MVQWVQWWGFNGFYSDHLVQQCSTQESLKFCMRSGKPEVIAHGKEEEHDQKEMKYVCFYLEDAARQLTC